MDIPTVKAETRKAAGTRAADRLRRSGKLPGIVYGHKQEPVPVVLDRHTVQMHLDHGAHLLQLDLSGKSQPCLVKDAQYDHLGATLVHVDLARVDLSNGAVLPVNITGKFSDLTPLHGADGMVYANGSVYVAFTSELIRVTPTAADWSSGMSTKVDVPDGMTDVVSTPNGLSLQNGQSVRFAMVDRLTTLSAWTTPTVVPSSSRR